MKSILQKEKECFICKNPYSLECHHIYPGSANRKKSEKTGLKVWLCHDHHTGGPDAVHNNPRVMRWLKETGQAAFEKTHSREEFMRIFGRTYL